MILVLSTDEANLQLQTVGLLSLITEYIETVLFESRLSKGSNDTLPFWRAALKVWIDKFFITPRC